MERFRFEPAEVDESIMRELGKYLLKTGVKVMLGILAALMVGMAAITLWAGSYFLGVICLVAAVALGAEQLLIQRKIIRTTIRRMKETSGKASYTYEITLTDTGVNVHNFDTNAQAEMKYGTFARLVQTAHTYTLFTKQNQFVVLKKDCMQSFSGDQVVAHLKKNCTELRTIKC